MEFEKVKKICPKIVKALFFMTQVSCQDSTTTTLEDKITSSDLIITASLEQKMGMDLFHVHRDGRRPLKGGGDVRGDFWLKVNSSSPCFESYSVAGGSGRSPQVLFLRRVGEEPLFAPRFHPLPFSTKLVELMQKIIDSHQDKQKKNQPSAVPVRKTNGRASIFVIFICGKMMICELSY